MYSLLHTPYYNKQKGIGNPFSCCNHYLLIFWLGVVVPPHRLGSQSPMYYYYTNSHYKLTFYTHKNKISQQSIFKSDLRLANQYSQHIRSMVTINLCHGRDPMTIDHRCNVIVVTLTNLRPYGTLFPHNFQSIFRTF